LGHTQNLFVDQVDFVSLGRSGVNGIVGDLIQAFLITIF
jgi:hypothetical protein